MKKYLLAINYEHYSAYIPEKYFIEIFNTNRNWEQIEADKYNKASVNFLYNSKNSKFYNMLSDIGNIFHPYHLKYLTNKYNLYKTLEKYTPETYKRFMVKHYEVDINNPQNNKHLFTGNKIYILRPTWGFARHGITIYNNYKDYEKFINISGKRQYLNALNKKNKIDYNMYNTYKYVLSDYLQNQLLFKNRIINFRIFFILTYIKNKYRGYLLKHIVIHTSSKDKKNNVNNLDLNELITGTTYTTKDYYFEDFINEYGIEKGDYVLNQFKHVLSKLLKIIKYKNVMKNYNNFNNTYDIFGLDFIIDDNFNIKLVEFNDKVGLKDYPDVIYSSLATCILNGTINKLYDKEYHIKIDKNIKKNIIRIHSNKKYL